MTKIVGTVTNQHIAQQGVTPTEIHIYSSEKSNKKVSICYYLFNTKLAICKIFFQSLCVVASSHCIFFTNVDSPWDVSR